jgi:DNA-binding CsgD family transcriptional regulator
VQETVSLADRDAIIEGIYEAAALPERWPDVLRRLGETVQTPGLVLLTQRSDSWVGHTASPLLEQPLLQYLQTDIPARSQTTARLLAADHAGFVDERQLFTPQEWEAEPFRHEWARPNAFNHCAATAIGVPNGDLLVCHLQRREKEPPFAQRELGILDSFRPHLARAAMLAARWRLQRLVAATEALALIGLPAAVIDRNRKVVTANALIQAATGYIRWLPQNRVALADLQSNEMLNQALSGLFQSATAAACSFPVRVGDGTALVAHVIPTPGQARDLFDGGLAILLLTPIGAERAPDLALIRALYVLTPGEARVARNLTQGQTIEEIAVSSGVTVATVRTQVKAVLDKTGTRRQAEVTALLAGLPRLPFK